MTDQSKALADFRGLPPIEPRELIGLWRGHGVPTGHPLDGVLENLGWFGKRFTPDMRADALLFQTGERRLTAIDPARIPLGLAFRFHKFGKMRVARKLFPYLQRSLRAKGPVATLQTLSFEGNMSAAVVYDNQPVVDHFRRIGETRIMGAMTIRNDNRIYFFLLDRVEDPLIAAI